MIATIKKFSPLLLLLVLSYFSWRPLLTLGYFSMHDDQQVVRLQQMDKSLQAGQFPVRWVKDLGFGYGYPVFNFYPPLVYYLGESFHLISGSSFINSIKLVWAVALIGSAFSMYLLAKQLWGKFAGLVSAIFYLYAPYHAVDAYVRGALAELFSFVWLPLILLGAYKTITTPRPFRWSIVTGIFLALLMITHNLIFLPFVGFVTLWHFGLTFLYRKNLPTTILYFVIYILIAFGLSAFFWFPALTEKQFTLVDQLLIKNLASYQIHFVCPSQLWSSIWGFGGSVEGCFDGVSLALGKLHLLVPILSLLIAFYLREKAGRTLGLVVIGFVLFLFSLFMTLNYSRLIWDKIPQLGYLQFPWRFLEFATLFSSLLIGGLLTLVKNKTVWTLLGVVLAGLVILLTAKHFQPQRYILNASDEQLTSDYEVKWRVSATSFEYLPAGIDTKINERGVVWVNIDASGIAKEDYQVQKGSFQVEKSEFLPHKFEISGQSETESTIQFQITNFPTWELTLDSERLTVNDDNPYKLLTVNVPPGKHTIQGQFKDTPVRTAGNLVTVAMVASLCAYFFYELYRNRK